MLKGIDAAYVQGVIDWDKVKPQIDFAIIRAGYGKGNIDEHAAHNLSECNRLGIPCGVFWFSYALNEDMVVAEAEAVLDFVKDYRIELPIFYDFEYDSVDYAEKQGVAVNGTLISKFNDVFCQTVKEAGYYPAIYANSDYINNLLDMSLLGKYDLWYAHYGIPGLDHDCAIWQHTDSLTLAGIVGNVDGDYMYVDYPSIIRAAGMNKLAAPVVLDNTPDDYAASAIQKAVEKGIMKGDDHGNYKLHEPVTRQDVLVFMERAGSI